MISILSNRMALVTAMALTCAGLIAVFPEISAQFCDQQHTNPVDNPHATVQSIADTAANTPVKTDTIIAPDIQATELNENEVDVDVDVDHVIASSRSAPDMKSRLLTEKQPIQPWDFRPQPSGAISPTAPQNQLRVAAEHPL